MLAYVKSALWFVAPMFLISVISLVPCTARSSNEPVDLSGYWSSPLGTIKVKDLGTEVIGIAGDEGPCFTGSEEIMRGTVVEDTFSGKFLYCPNGPGCPEKAWGYTVLLISPKGDILSGSLAIKWEKNCKVSGFDNGSGLTLKRMAEKKSKQPGMVGPIAIGESKGYDPRNAAPKKKAGQALKNGEALLKSGRFEAARREFQKAASLDPTNPVAFNGIGVTYYARHNYEKALENYKKALQANPNFGDAYYNMACIYALTEKPNLALKYLRIALLNGFVEFENMKKDPDLKSLHDNPEFKRILSGDF